MPPARLSRIEGEIVGVGAWKTGQSTTLITLALGSCIAVCMWDASTGIGGLLHFLLPEAKTDPAQGRSRPGMFADSALPLFRDDLLKAGARSAQLRAKLIGGASVPNAPAMFQIGKRNILAAKRLLWQAGLVVVAEETGGSISRSIRFNTVTGIVVVTTPGLPPKEV